ncbi:unnamed protein product [Didymodactylos carnosus]|uniref:C2 domain-containing protein n=1 Tax=Didymodactylos carnosus TaxID=1234261 RepID=A0A815JLB3_9BILA|nr:unnamed protein product [Didymodactylos carnosus]
MNYQGCDDYMALNYGRFLDNGGCGYVGQYLARRVATRDIVDPYVKVFIYGVDSDYQQRKTRVVEDNGLNPVWNETMVFNITVPELCLVRFVVFDSDTIGSDDILASFCLPLTTIQTGYRHIHLREVDDDPTYSTLFVHVDIQHNTDDQYAVL